MHINAVLRVSLVTEHRFVLSQVKTWKLAAEQAATLAESANHRAAAAEAELANSSISMLDQKQQLAQQAQSVLRLGDQLKQLQEQLKCRYVALQALRTICDIYLESAYMVGNSPAP